MFRLLVVLSLVCVLFQSRKANSISYFRLEMLENNTLWGGTYLYGLYMGVPSTPQGGEGVWNTLI